MRTHTSVLPILLSLLLLTACGTDSAKASDPDQTKKSDLDQAQHIEQFQPETTTQALGAEGDIGDDTPLEWPAERMGSILPAPNAVITSIDQGSAFFGEGAPDYITVVSLKGMDSKSCEDYADRLEQLGFTDDVTTQDTGTKYLYSGSMDSDGTGVTFQYDLSGDTGFISYNPMLTSDFLKKWPAERMGNIPDPGCDLISFESEGKGQDEICTVEFATMNEKAAENYAADLEALGYLPETNTSDGEWIMFKGFDDSGSGVVFNYSVIYENGTISYGKKDAFPAEQLDI